MRLPRSLLFLISAAAIAATAPFAAVRPAGRSFVCLAHAAAYAVALSRSAAAARRATVRNLRRRWPESTALPLPCARCGASKASRRRGSRWRFSPPCCGSRTSRRSTNDRSRTAGFTSASTRSISSPAWRFGFRSSRRRRFGRSTIRRACSTSSSRCRKGRCWA